MSVVGFKATALWRGAAGAQFTTEVADKVDMSLDDIIRLQQMEQSTIPQETAMGPYAEGPHQRGWRQCQGFIGDHYKGVSPLNRPYFSQKPHNHAELPWQPYVHSKRATRRFNSPVTYQPQRDVRQAAFQLRKNMKICARVVPPRETQTDSSSSLTISGGILMVSIENPVAHTPCAPHVPTQDWSLSDTYKEEEEDEVEERKAPKGVSLEFDINTLGKQTMMTLNERFCLLKKKSVDAPRFVTMA